MKRIIFALMFVITLTFANTCAAKDVWVDHWQSENINIYVMDDTIIDGASGKSFSVTTKFVQNGRLKKNVVWQFSKWRDDMWRYETNTMSGGHTTVVIPRNKIFEFCMDSLAWSYTTDGRYYY